MQPCIGFSTSVYKVKYGCVVEAAEFFWDSPGRIAPERTSKEMLRVQGRRSTRITSNPQTGVLLLYVVRCGVGWAIDGRVEKIPDEEKADMHSDLLSNAT